MSLLRKWGGVTCETVARVHRPECRLSRKSWDVESPAILKRFHRFAALSHEVAGSWNIFMFHDSEGGNYYGRVYHLYHQTHCMGTAHAPLLHSMMSACNACGCAYHECECDGRPSISLTTYRPRRTTWAAPSAKSTLIEKPNYSTSPNTSPQLSAQMELFAFVPNVGTR